MIISSLIISLFYLQAKAQYDIVADPTEGCTPLKVKFNFNSTATTDSIATYYWSFGNGVTSNEMDPDTVLFETAGVYDPTLVLVFAGGSESWIVKPGMITVHNTVKASFQYERPSESFLYYEFKQNAVLDTGVTYDFEWTLVDFGSRTGPDQQVTFPGADTFVVILTITDEFGCSSSVTKTIPVLEEITIPNVFTPDDDGRNDFFVVRSNGDIPLRIKIFTRTGVLVYETEGPVITWNGQTASGDKLKSGIYYYSLEAINGDPYKVYTKTGFFHIYGVR